MKKWLLVLCALLFFSGLAQARIIQDEALRFFIKADLAYKDGKYSDAQKYYEQILAGGIESGAVYYNLANSYFKQGILGKAVLNYERAQRLIPRDADLATNRQYAFSRIKAAPLSADQSFLEKWEEASRALLTLNEVGGWILFVLILATGVHLVSLYFPIRKSRLRAMLIALGLLAVVLLLDVGLRLKLEKGQAIVLAESAVKFEPRNEATTYFDVYEGQSVRVLKTEGMWYKIERIDGKMGWVLQDKIEKI